MTDYLSFRLPDEFIAPYADRQPDWGYPIGGGASLGEITFFNNYSRVKEDGTKERWHECCRRVVEGMFSILKDHCLHARTHWNENKALASAKEAYDRMFAMKWLPPGRGLWAMGTPPVNGERNSAMLYNCAVVSTEHITPRSVKDAVWPFVRLTEMSMNGIGVGFDTRGAGKIRLHSPSEETETFVVPDTREGWAESVGVLLESFFFENRSSVEFDYSKVRPEGSPLKRFGGTASGPEPLRRAHVKISELLEGRDGDELTARDIVDIMNLCAKAVVAGGARRSALLAAGELDDKEFISLKDYNKFPERNGENGWGHLSNNSVFVNVGDNIDHLIDRIADNGEPGLLWLDVARNYGRLCDAPDGADQNVIVTNPCAEIVLENAELCNLSELFPIRHASLDDFKRSIKFAFMYNKAVTLLPTPWPETNEVINRNRRIGLSVSGSAQFVETRDWSEYRIWLDTAYGEVCHWDRIYSSWLGVRESIRKTTSKPSGSVSLLTGATPGVHWPTASTYIRRMRMRWDSPMLKVLEEAGFTVEADVMDPDFTAVVELPVRGPDVRTEAEVSVWEKVALAAMVQEQFADNSVSITATFRDDEKDQIAPLIRAFEGKLKSLSFLPIVEGGSYAQMPYESVSDEYVEDSHAVVEHVDWAALYDGEGNEDGVGEKFCTTDKCELPLQR